MARKSRWPLAVAAIAGALALPTPASAAWTVPLPISPDAHGGNIRDVDVAFDAAGNAVAAWTRHPSGANADIWAATRPQGGAWSEPVKLTTDAPSHSGDDAFVPSVVVAPSGRAVIMWTENTALIPSRTVVSAATAKAGESIGSAVTLSATSVNASPAEPVFDAGDTAHLVYGQGLSADNAIYSRTLAADASEWSSPEVVAPSMSVPQYDLDFDIDENGNQVLAWSSDYFGDWDVNVAYRRPGESWSALQIAVDEPTDPQPRVAIGDRRAVVVWGESRWSKVDLRDILPVWDDPVELATGERVKGAHSDASGAVHVLTWSDAVKVHTLEQGASSFGAGVPVDGSSPGQYEYDPAMAVAPHGEIAVAWRNASSGVGVAVGSGSSYDTSTLALGADPMVYSKPSPAFDGLGNVAVAFDRDRGPDRPKGPDLSVLDRTAPVLESSVFEAEGMAGQSLLFSATASDDWSPVTYSWDMGDGAAAVESASHSYSYATAGVKSVQLTINAGGSRTEQIGQVTVAPAKDEAVINPPAPTPTATPTPQTQPQAPPAETVVKALETFVKPPVVNSKTAKFTQTFPSLGKAVWGLYLNKVPVAAKARAAKKAKPVLLGKSSKTIAGAGEVSASVKIKKSKSKALRKARKAKVYLQTTFTDAFGRTFVTVSRVKVKK